MSEETPEQETSRIEDASKGLGCVQPSERVPGKFDAVLHDGSIHPYAFRTKQEAQAIVDASKTQ